MWLPKYQEHRRKLTQDDTQYIFILFNAILFVLRRVLRGKCLHKHLMIL